MLLIVPGVVDAVDEHVVEDVEELVLLRAPMAPMTGVILSKYRGFVM